MKTLLEVYSELDRVDSKQYIEKYAIDVDKYNEQYKIYFDNIF